MIKLFILVFFVIFSGVFSHTAIADIYEYIDEAGITHYSDAPSNDNYVLILKSDQPANASASSNNPDSNLEVLANRHSTATLSSPQLLAQIEQSALNHQLSSELIHAVMHVESAYKVKAKSYKGAQGLMQLMPATASRLGVKNSYDPVQNIEGGAKYLKELLTLFNNDVTLALAAYNAGESAVIRYGNKIPPYKETQAYVPKVLNIYRALIKQRGQENGSKQVMQGLIN